MTEDIKDKDLTSLISYVDATLSATDRVRKILQNECDEAKFVLRPWIVESIITRDSDDEHFCTCEEENVNEQAEEIAVGIDKAITQAQQLREKITRNIADHKQRDSTIDIQKIYRPTSTSRNELPKLTVNKSKVPKNFIAANKFNVKAISQKNAQIAKKQKLEENNCDILMMKKSLPSITQLNDLIKKVSLSIEIQETPLSSTTSINKNDPFLTGEPKKKVIERKQTAIGIVDGIEQFGMPKNLLSVLKAYHSYVTDLTEESANTRDRPAAQKFLRNFNKYNESCRATLHQSNDKEFLLQEFSKLYRDLHSKNLEAAALSKIKTKYSELDQLSKKCVIKKYDTLKAKKSGVEINSPNECVSRGWLSNGIWNWSCLQYFSHFTNVPYIPYTNKNQLLSLFDVSQRLQQSVYQNNLIDIILHDIIPMMKIKFNPGSEEYVEMFKMILTIVQILNLKPPVLVRTET